MHISLFFLLNLLVLHGYCMFNPMIHGNRGGCVDVKAYFAVDNEESDNESSEDSSDDDFFHVENLEVTENQKNQNSLLQNSLRQNSLDQRNANSQSSMTQNSLALQNQSSLIQNSLNQKNLNSQSSLIQNSLSSQTQNNQNSLAVQSEASTTGACPNEGNGNCQPGWKNFTRPSGEWCIKIFYEDSLTHSKAEERCQAHGATLSGLQNQMEAQYIFSAVTIGIYPGSGSIWVGLKRKKECENLGWTVNCTWDKAFEWTDKSATGSDGMAWACNQPDNARNRSQNCVTLTASYAGTVLGFQTGLLDDVGCDFDYIKENRKERNIRAYVCGKKSKV